jgi:hypothetical protein
MSEILNMNIVNNQLEILPSEVFRSRYSVVLIIIVFSPLVFIIYNFIKKPDFILLIPLLILALVILITSGINYVITDNRLIFKTWFINNGEINISSIIKVERTYFVLASNAGSLKRLTCKLKKGSKYPFLLISPINEERFLERLKQINPDIIFKVENKKGFYRFWDWDI